MASPLRVAARLPPLARAYHRQAMAPNAVPEESRARHADFFRRDGLSESGASGNLPRGVVARRKNHNIHGETDMPRRLPTAAAACLSIWAGQAVAAPDYSAIYSFGDSLSDVGNAFIYTSIPGNGPVQPAPPYFMGEFSNGPIWLQDLAPALGLAPLTPSFPPFNGNDYAVGDASTGTTPIYTAGPGDLPAQILAFEASHPGGAPSSALYTFSIG